MPAARGSRDLLSPESDGLELQRARKCKSRETIQFTYGTQPHPRAAGALCFLSRPCAGEEGGEEVSDGRRGGLLLLLCSCARGGAATRGAISYLLGSTRVRDRHKSSGQPGAPAGEAAKSVASKSVAKDACKRLHRRLLERAACLVHGMSSIELKEAYLLLLLS